MLVTGEVEYTAGGYPSPTYSGTKTVTANVDDDAELEEIEAILEHRAIKAIREEYCGLSIRITKLSVRKGG